MMSERSQTKKGKKKKRERRNKERDGGGGRVHSALFYLYETLRTADCSRMTAGRGSCLGMQGNRDQIGRSAEGLKGTQGGRYAHDPDCADGFMCQKLPELYPVNTGSLLHVH